MPFSADSERLVKLIRAFCESHSDYLVQHPTNSDKDSHGPWRELDLQCRSVAKAIETFLQDWKDVLPSSMEFSIREVMERNRQFIAEDPIATKATRHGPLARVSQAYGALVAQLEYDVADHQVGIGRRTERAFLHLQRSIVVDSEVRSRWQAAFGKGETECERFGSVHLLTHGIWAFKANAEGERTDLIISEEPFDVTAAQRAAEGLVLTEWKISRRLEDGDQCYADAREQAGRYACGSLAGVELRGVRYLIVVSEKHLPERADEVVKGLTYRHINIVVDPDSPSKHSRNPSSRARRGRRRA